MDLELRRRSGRAQALDIAILYADPYSSWQRGINEITNGLVRQYISKKTDFSLLSDDHITLVNQRLNNRPRKCLGFRTPNEILNNHFVERAIGVRHAILRFSFKSILLDRLTDPGRRVDAAMRGTTSLL